MHEANARLAALLRYLQTEQVEHVVADETSPEQGTSIIVAVDTLRRLPELLNEFCRRTGMCLVHHWYEAGDQGFMLSWLNVQQRPQFVTLRSSPTGGIANGTVYGAGASRPAC
jgi:hypothetical protein